MKMIFFVVFFSSFFSWARFEVGSSKLSKFEVQNCFENKCFKAHGEQGFVSQDGGTLVGLNVALEFSDAMKSKIKTNSCETFRFNVVEQNWLCDNAGNQQRSLIVDSKMLIHEI